MLAASCVLDLQEFAEFFEAQTRPRRLVGFSKRGTVHYATPGATLLLGHLPLQCRAARITCQGNMHTLFVRAS